MIEQRKANKEELPKLMHMLDRVFFKDDEEKENEDFLSLLPKLYKQKYQPWENNYCVFENDEPMAAVGMYVNELSIAGEKLKLGGIGNVAVLPETRGRGYMKLTMDMAMQAIKDENCDIAELSGDRHRYRYWGFDKAGVMVRASFSAVNLKHAFGKHELAPGWVAREVLPEDAQVLQEIQGFLESQAIHVKHDKAAMHDILCSWRETPYAIFCEDRLAGVFTLSDDKSQAKQLYICDWVENLEMPLRAVLSALPEKSEVNMSIPAWNKDLIAKMEALTENFTLDTSGQFCVLNWQKVLYALLLLQSQCKKLLDGEVKIKIVGYNGDECLKIAVNDGAPSVEQVSEDSCDIALGHFEATSLFLAPVSPWRKCSVAQNRFPLPLMINSMDTV